MISIGEEGEYELLVNLIFDIKEIYYYRIIYKCQRMKMYCFLVLEVDGVKVGFNLKVGYQDMRMESLDLVGWNQRS